MEIRILTQNDFWMDNALENFYKLLNDVKNTERHCLDVQYEVDGIYLNMKNEDALLHLLQKQIRAKHDRVIFQQIKDKKGLNRNIRLEYVLLPYGKQIAGRNVLVEQFYDSKETGRFLQYAINRKPGPRRCILCNRPFEKNVGKLKQGVYPLATKNRALSGIRKKSDYIDELCATCFVTGVLEWTDEGLPYRCGLAGHSILLFPQFSNFQDLVKFKELSRKMLEERNLTSNIRVKASGVSDSYTGGMHSTLLLFIEQLIINFLRQKDNETVLGTTLNRIICKDWISLKIPSGVVKDVKCSSIRIADSTLDIASSVTRFLQKQYSEIVSEAGIYSTIIAKLNFKPQPGRPISWDLLRELTFQLRESLAQSFLENDMHSFASVFLPRKGLNINLSEEAVIGVDVLLMEWQFKPIGLSGRDIESIKESAKVMAEVCSVNAGLLYQMDRARTAPDFIFTLKEVAKKLVVMADKMAEGTIKMRPKSLEDFFQLLATREDQWKLLRDTLVLYTSIACTNVKMSRGS